MTSTHDPGADPFIGAVLGGRYRLEALIGRGGMASVYRAHDLSLGRAVAVKVFAEAAEGIDDAARRGSEIALLAGVEHRALVRLYDASRDPASAREYFVMELVDGHDLREALRGGPLGAADVAGILADIGEALHVIHERGIVHRDVKPANVLLAPAHLPTRTWNAKLADFGIARLIDDTRLTRTGLLVGTPGYLSPEQVSGVAPGPAADVYSLGLLALEARTGQAAFPGPAVEAASARLVRDPEIPERLGADWVALLRAMTAREPEARPSALDVAVAAARLGTAPGPVSATGPTMVLPASDGAVGAGAAGVGVVGAAGVGVVGAGAVGAGVVGAGAGGPGAEGADAAGASAVSPMGATVAAGAAGGTGSTAVLRPSEPAATDRPSRRRRPVVIVAALAVAAAAVVLITHAVVVALPPGGAADPGPSPSAPADSGTPSEVVTPSPTPTPTETETDDEDDSGPGKSGDNRNDKGNGKGKGKDGD